MHQPNAFTSGLCSVSNGDFSYLAYKDDFPYLNNLFKQFKDDFSCLTIQNFKNGQKVGSRSGIEFCCYDFEKLQSLAFLTFDLKKIGPKSGL